MNPKISETLRYALLVSIAVILLTPIYWLIMSSLRPADHIFRFSGNFSIETLIPFAFTLDNYSQALQSNIGRALFNSLFVSLTTVICSVFVNSLAGFAFAVFDFRFKKLLFVYLMKSQHS